MIIDLAKVLWTMGLVCAVIAFFCLVFILVERWL